MDPDRVATFRLGSDPLAMRPGDPPAAAERLADHRRHYLTYQGAVSGGRGTVERIVEGIISAAVCDPRRIELAVALGSSRRRLTLWCEDAAGVGSLWRVQAVSLDRGTPTDR